ncbi:MAG TPA: c-type cytochrome [Candidatus Sulfopaludibacter sp.]|nr:c-type cytochrome [Candidatus Sulfopaludibacter sp.]
MTYSTPALLFLAGIAYAQTAAPPPDPAVGRKIFESQCALCHGQTGGGGRGPSLNRPALAHAPDDDALRQVISGGIPPEMPGAWQLNPHEVASVAAYVRSLGAVAPEKLPGDPANGERVYQRSECANCHMIGGAGVGFGPELTAIGSRRNGSFLRQKVTRPAAALPDDFEYIAATPAAGTAVRGIRVNEDSFTIQLKEAGGRFHSFRKSALRDLRRLEHQTPMPSYEKLVTGADLDDLVAYLAGLRGKS